MRLEACTATNASSPVDLVQQMAAWRRANYSPGKIPGPSTSSIHWRIKRHLIGSAERGAQMTKKRPEKAMAQIVIRYLADDHLRGVFARRSLAAHLLMACWREVLAQSSANRRNKSTTVMETQQRNSA